MEIKYSECLGWFYRRHPEKIKDYIESVSPKQIQCKKWLVDELSNIPAEFKNIQLFGGWYGYPLIDMLSKVYDINSLVNIDCDESAILVNKRFSREYFKHDFVNYSTKKVEDYKYDVSHINLVINTSSEHMPDLPELIKDKSYDKTCVFALQSNNMFDLEEQHINCVNSADELVEKSKLSQVLYSGKKMFDNYERYMVIGLRGM